MRRNGKNSALQRTAKFCHRHLSKVNFILFFTSVKNNSISLFTNKSKTAGFFASHLHLSCFIIFKSQFTVTDSKSHLTPAISESHFYNYPNDIYCMNVNSQQSNQFLSYQNYHHDQITHHQYFDEAPQSYNFIPYPTSETYPVAAQVSDQVQQQESFPPMQSNELYEFLPEEIFQLDQPIVKSESQTAFNSLAVASTVNVTMDTLQLPFANTSGDISSSSHSFLDLSSGQIQTNVKYPMDNFSSEINNNGSYDLGVESQQSKLQHENNYGFQEPQTRLNCAVESEKILKRKHLEADPKLQNYHQPLFSKRESSCLMQGTASYYHPDLYSSFPSKPNDVYRSMEKYNGNFITNN